MPPSNQMSSLGTQEFNPYMPIENQSVGMPRTQCRRNVELLPVPDFVSETGTERVEILHIDHGC